MRLLRPYIFTARRRATWISALTVVAAMLGMPATAQVPQCVAPTPATGFNSTLHSSRDGMTLQLPYLPNETTQLLTESWVAYRDRFIAEDGRVIDWERADQHTTSEGQAYAMLRAVFIDDRETFHRTLAWAEENLARRDAAGQLTDSLWAWRWGQQMGQWGILDENFASDADIDAITALLLAANRWDCAPYRELALQKLADLWEISTLDLRQVDRAEASDRLLLPGPREAFFPEPDTVILNPSYVAPYAFRLFAQADPSRDWMSLVDSGYRMLEEASDVSRRGLPGDWVRYDPRRDRYRSIPRSFDSNISSNYSFDAFRVWWRVALDAAWYREPRAFQYLETHSAYLQKLWQEDQAIPARISRRGRALVDYEATSQYAMLYPAFRLIEPELAAQIRDQKLMPNYSRGFWDNDAAYYTHNLAWFGLLPLERPSFSSTYRYSLPPLP
ncbi:MAG: glycosyl hydrolase family 8 [Cyanobacteria bacterium P01_A01_bin.135]